jgi:hypothetical protein
VDGELLLIELRVIKRSGRGEARQGKARFSFVSDETGSLQDKQDKAGLPVCLRKAREQAKQSKAKRAIPSQPFPPHKCCQLTQKRRLGVPLCNAEAGQTANNNNGRGWACPTD